jgi:hypothetical protein
LTQAPTQPYSQFVFVPVSNYTLFSACVGACVKLYLTLSLCWCLCQIIPTQAESKGELRCSLDTRHRVKTNKTKHRGELRCSLGTRHRVKTNKTKHRGELRCSLSSPLCFVLFVFAVCLVPNEHLSSPLCFVLFVFTIGVNSGAL